jgi:hypothetical protein
VDLRAVLDAVVKRKIPSPGRESNPRTAIVQPVAQRFTRCWKYANAKVELGGMRMKFYVIDIRLEDRETCTTREA